MKTIIVTAMLIAAFSSCSVRPKLYSREMEDQRYADSLKVADSLRVADSIRVADSCMIARYRKADSEIHQEKQHRQDSVFSEMFVFEDAQPVQGLASDDADAISARTIAIDPDNPLAKKVDSLEAEYNRKNNLLHDGDNYFRGMKKFAVSEKIRYMRFLMENQLKDLQQINTYCNSLVELYRIRQEFFLAIQQSQKGNAKSFVRLHIEEHKRKIEELGNFIVALTPEVPFYPERVQLESNAGE